MSTPRGPRHKDVTELLREAGAVRRSAAKPLPSLTGTQRRRIERLTERGVIRRAAAGAYYLDELALKDLHAAQLKLLFVTTVIGAGLAAAFALGAG